MKTYDKDDSIAKRKASLLAGNEVELGIEDRFTNLRIFKGSKGDNIYFRLDCANAYSAPLKDETVKYLNKENPIINKLNELYGFDRATLEDIDNILELTKTMTIRPCIEW